MGRGTITGLLMALAAAGAAAAAPTPAPADLVLVHGRIITEDSQDRVVSALAVAKGRILAIGSDREILAMAGKGTRIIDLGGRAATSGLIDSHAHIAEGGTDEVFGVVLNDAHSIADIAKVVAARAATLKPGEWVQGAGWDEGKLSDGRLPVAADLDKAAPDHPVWLVHTTGHYAVVNSVALRLAGITAQTPNPTAGTIDRDAAGNPTGVLREDGALDLVARLIPEASVEQVKAGILHEIAVLHREGITAIKDPNIHRPDWDAYRSLLAEGKLKERVCVLWGAGASLTTAQAALTELQAAPRAPDSLGDGRLLSCGAKIFMDGSAGARTAWASEDWNIGGSAVDTGNKGYPLTDPETYRAMLKLFHQARYAVGTHAIGDRAIDWVVDGYDALFRADPAPGLRHTIIHGNAPSAHAIDVMASLQRDHDAGYPEAQAEFLWWIGSIYASSYGPERAPHVIPLRSWALRGIRWGGGSDFPVTPVAARYGLWASMARETVGGSAIFGSGEAIGIGDALRSYTRWNAPLLYLEDKIGSLEPGKRADIAVWDRDPLTAKTADIKEMKCLMTIFEGEIVYRAEQGAPQER